MGKHYEQLKAEARPTIMLMASNNDSARAIARLLRRAPSTISPEFTRFTAGATPAVFQLSSALNSRSDAPVSTRVSYDACGAGARARRERHKCRRPSKLATDTVLFGVVQHFLGLAWSPSQIACTLKLMWPDEPERTVSHETIYTCIYAMPRGELRREFIASLRRAKSKRMPRSRGEDRRGQLPELLSIHVRPLEVNDRAFPGHWEGDLIKGAGNRSAVGVLVERSSALVILIKLADATATSALEGFTAKLRSVAEPMRKTLTYDQGTDLPVRSQDQLDAIVDSLNSRPRAMHGFYPPIAVYRAMLEILTQPDYSIQYLGGALGA